MLHYSDKPEIEYLAGRAVPKVSPKRTHAVVQLTLGAILMRCAGNRGQSGTEWRMHLSGADEPRTSLVPDVSFCSYERLATLSPQDREEPSFVPDIAIEVRSPSDRLNDVDWKMKVYLRRGAIVALDVLPQERTIRAFTSKGRRVFHESEEFGFSACPWFTFHVAEAFADLDS